MTSTLAEQRYDVAIERDVRIPTADPAVTLSGDLFLPAGAGPVPVLLTLLPYRRDLAAMNGSVAERWFAARGYASLLVDLAGTGSSDGRQRPPFDPAETDDAVAAIEWAVGQPWCSGAVGMWGHSYGAMTAMRTASLHPPALAAIIAVQGTPDPELDFTHPGGSRGAAMPLGIWSRNTLWSQLLPPLDDYLDEAEQARWQRRIAASPYLLDLYRRDPGDPAWAASRIDASAIDVPALCVAGWRDLFADGMVRAYEQLSGPKRLIAGPWMHSMPDFSPDAPIDFLSIALSWWDRWLRGCDVDAETPRISVHVQGERPRWLGFEHWPPAEGNTVDLSSWQRIEPRSPDPTVGALSGLWATPDGPFGLPRDQHDDDMRSLCYTSPPLEAPLLLSGRPTVTLTNPWQRMSVKLTDVDQAGRSTLICAGLRAEPKATDTLQVALAPTTYEMAAGHRLRIAIAPGDFPRVWPQASSSSDWPGAAGMTLPVVHEEQATPVDYPAPGPGGVLDVLVRLLAAAQPPTPPKAAWEITEDLLGDTVSVSLATNFATVLGLNTHGRAHTMRVGQHLLATANRREPADSSITSRITTTIDTESGQHIVVTATITATAAGLDATARVVLDSSTLADLRWRA